ncbi:MAG TPA: NAD/NADP octopine/nopaline dehydrogenase family protein [bacterium]|nr:NAD/NADP octopine/nopaline dehydrogenase family protein [bacterium]
MRLGAARFVAGEDLDACMAVLRRLNERGLLTNSLAPNRLDHRYLIEDVPYGLVALAELAQVADVATPPMKSLVSISSVLASRNFWVEGRTLDKMGLSGIAAKITRTDVRQVDA